MRLKILARLPVLVALLSLANLAPLARAQTPLPFRVFLPSLPNPLLRDIVSLAVVDGRVELAAYNMDGSGFTALTNNDLFEDLPSWSRDSKRLVFVARPEAERNTPLDIYTVNYDGSGFRQVTNTPDAYEDYPQWSPDGTQIAFTFGSEAGYGLAIIDVDGRNRRQLTSRSLYGGPRWSPDGTQLIFVTESDQQTEVRAIKRDGTGERVLATIPGQQPTGLALSPDGATIAFATLTPSETASNSQLVTMSSNGSGQTMILTSTTVLFDQLQWAPNSKTLAFISSGQGGARYLSIINSDGSAKRDLTGLEGQVLNPRWSPDGARLLYGTFSNITYIIDRDGSNNRVLRQETGQAVWSPRAPCCTRYAVFSNGTPSTP